MIKSTTLVINRNYQPVSTICVKKAITLLYKEIAVVIHNSEEYDWNYWVECPIQDDDIIQSVNFKMKLPEVIKIQTYSGYRPKNTKFSKRAVFLRDQHQCQYCGIHLNSKSITLDHILPVSRKGATTWSNCVTCCVKCNTKKGNKLLYETGMSLLKTPIKPNLPILCGKSVPFESWRSYLNE